MLARLSLVLGLLLGILTLAKCDDTHNSTNLAVSTLYIPDLNATFSINLPTDSEDLNFFISAPIWTSWFGIGFGGAMTNSLMLVVYSAADNQHVTVSPRLGTGDSEPPFYPSAKLSLGEGSSIQNDFFVVSGTCRGCRSWTTGALNLSSTVQPFILAVGPGIDLASDDPSVRLRRHSAYSHFTMNMVQATGIGSADALATINLTATTGANMAGDIKADQQHGPLAHGVLLALAALIIAPLDMVVAGALRSWPILHILSSSTLVIFIVAAIGVGISLSHQYIETQHFATPHQILGFIVLSFILVMLLLGIFRRVVAKSAAKQGQEPPERTGLFTHIHVWAGRILWILLLVNNGLGLQFSFAQKFLIIGYSVLAAGIFIMMILIELTIYYCCARKRKSTQEEDEADHQLAQFYGSH